ncbi:hypothetical protein NDR87_32075 [Nocardia sp. CDC159]|uniref:Uncharacterized protein n=1 Tax=Nocardia pulmonis TaxID=2951408 RepID=A0A9X2ED19_9NOCA|nr:MULTISPECIES: hypothetical protein [Nocardia]MCM6778130.1 hypothetical protein [Nocardia pulmonis]MCM6791019.1 hypothetical protein [Nocardia sp. CDC159]
MSDPYPSTSDAGDTRLHAEAERHRQLLRRPVDEYRRRVAQRAHHLDPAAAAVLTDQAERLIADLLIDPTRHRALNIDAYRAIRDGLPVRYDARHHQFVARTSRREIHIHPNGPERRLGIIARLATAGVDLDQILTVAAVVITHPGSPGEASDPPSREGEPERYFA